MKKVWKWVMHLNAKVFCLIAALFFVATTGWCMYLYLTPPEPIKEGSGQLPPPPEPWNIGVLDYVTHQLSGEDLTIPIEPFRPTLDAILTNAELRAAFEAALKGNQAVAGGGGGAGKGGAGGGKPQDASAGGHKPQGTPGVKMIEPKITFNGFIKRSDGSSAAQFSDSSDNSTVFFSPGKTVHGVEILNVNMKEATVRYADGSEGKIPIRGSIVLAPEPEKPKPAAAAVKPEGGEKGKPGGAKQPKAKG